MAVIVAAAVMVALAFTARRRARSPRQLRLRALALEIQALCAQKRAEQQLLPLFIGISGVPGAGKTTLARDIARYLPAGYCAVLPMDGYHYTRQELDAFENPAQAHRLRGAPFTFNAQLFARDLVAKKRMLRARGSVCFPSFDHALGDPVQDDIEIDGSVSVVIVEGNYLLLWQAEGLLPEAGDGIDFHYYLHCKDLNIPVARLTRRHQEAWNWTEERALARVLDSDYKNMFLVQANARGADGVILDV